MSSRLLTTPNGVSFIVGSVEHEAAVAGLPVTYQRILAWLDEGWSEDEIADWLGIDPHAVLPMIRLAEAKLTRLTRGDSPDAST